MVEKQKRTLLTQDSFLRRFVGVIRLGFEPKTPTLKVLCSTN
jgi:hypothetical protein